MEIHVFIFSIQHISATRREVINELYLNKLIIRYFLVINRLNLKVVAVDVLSVDASECQRKEKFDHEL